jgi:hypothetical protein
MEKNYLSIIILVQRKNGQKNEGAGYDDHMPHCFLLFIFICLRHSVTCRYHEQNTLAR